MDGVVPVAIALGSNLGDREGAIRTAVDALRPHFVDLRLSSLYATAPVGVGEQPEFLNGAVVGQCRLSADELLATMLDIERAGGRERPFPGAPRTLDLDLILYGDAVLDRPTLTVPHPRFRDRRFVLEPLAEIAADWRDPVTGRTIDELLRLLGS